MLRRTALLLSSLAIACGSAETPGAQVAEEPSANLATDPRLSEVVQAASFAEDHPDYASYWHAGLAEISRFALTQSRYGQAREGDAIFVFVTEPFLPETQVKHERSDGEEDVPVLKLNATRTFVTGIYPYNLMTSSFVPTDGSPSLKVSATVTEWCGMAFAQLNRRGGQVEADLRSYFQSEGDRDFAMDDVPFEDALWQELRRDPSALPTGELRLVPAMHALRLYHDELRPYRAVAELQEEPELSRYVVRYASLGRTLVIEFETAFPHAIVSFEETHGGETTRGVRTHSIMDAYWGHNRNDDEYLRSALGL